MEKEKVIMVVSPFEELERGVHHRTIEKFNLIQDIDDEVHIVFNTDTRHYLLYMPNSYWSKSQLAICIEEENVDSIIEKTYNRLTTEKFCVEIEKRITFLFNNDSKSFLPIGEEECNTDKKEVLSCLDFHEIIPVSMMNQNYVYSRHFLFEGKIVHVFGSVEIQEDMQYLVFQNYEPMVDRHFIHNVMNELMVLQIKDQNFFYSN